MERAYQRSDASYDGVFYLGVRTTGIFCRPSCPARKPKPENVEFFAMPKEALFAGYRPCLRCRPLEGDEAPPWVARLLQRVERRPDTRIRERDLRTMGVEPARVRRYFSTRYGLTFQAYCRARRLAQAFERIRHGGSVDDAVFETGYESHSGFREAFQKTFGLTPGRTAEGDCIRLAWLDTPMGPMVAGATDGGICLLEFTDRRMLEQQFVTLKRRFKAGLAPGRHPHLTTLRRELGEYFAGKRQVFDVPVDMRGTPFRDVGVARSFGRFRTARRAPMPTWRAASAAPQRFAPSARANGLNAIAIVVPCHRVVNKNGDLGGYGGGLWRKRRLLHLEAASTR